MTINELLEEVEAYLVEEALIIDKIKEELAEIDQKGDSLLEKLNEFNRRFK
jgi:hypothetical protein